MNKRGVSHVVEVVLLILMVFLAIMLIWLAFFPFIGDWIYSAEVTAELTQDRIWIPHAGPVEGNENLLDLILKRGPTELVDIEFEEMIVNEPIEEDVSVALFFLVDLSGSMIFELAELKGSTEKFIGEVLAYNSDNRVGGASLGLKYNESFTDNFDTLETWISSWEPDDSVFSLNKSITYSEKSFEELSSNFDQKVLIIWSDGSLDQATIPPNPSRTNIINFVEKMCFEEEIKTYTISFGNDLGGKAYLKNISVAGGGGNYSYLDTGDLAEIYENISNSIPKSRIVEREVSIRGVYLDVAIFHKDGNSFVHRIVRDVPGSNQQKRYSIELPEDWTSEDVTMVEVYIVAVTRGGRINSVLLTRHKLN